MWLLYNGQIHKSLNPIHIKRLIEEGAVEIEDPTAQDTLTAQDASQEPEQTTEPPVSPDGATQQHPQDEAPVSDPIALPQEDSKKTTRHKR
jgi:hypothetical protein